MDSPPSLERMNRFLAQVAGGSHIHLPFLVVMQDLTGLATHTHRLVHGEALCGR